MKPLSQHLQESFNPKPDAEQVEETKSQETVETALEQIKPSDDQTVLGLEIKPSEN